MLSFFRVVALIASVPNIGPKMSEPFVALMNHHKNTLHNRSEGAEDSVSAYY